MNKSDIVEKVAREAALSNTQAETAVNSLLEAITSALKTGEKVTLVGFGTFELYERAARTGRNPKTGEQIDIPTKNAIKFKAGSRLSSKID